MIKNCSGDRGYAGARASLKTTLFRRNEGSVTFNFCKKLNMKCSNMSASFDALEYARKLENSGLDRRQAEIQAEALKTAFNAYDEAHRKDHATKQDIQLAIKELGVRLLKWQFALAFALAAIMAKGFGWPGF